ncbi:MAG TPA: hypothetical protein VGB42_11130 [Candidatus Thermoplasmatota archaeon]
MSLRSWLRSTVPSDPSLLFRRYFVNTLFDANFVVLGILAAEAFGSDRDAVRALSTMFAACAAIGISTGVSVFEAEHVEESIRRGHLERAMMRRLDESETATKDRMERYLAATVNATAPFLVLGVTSAPLVLYVYGLTGPFELAALMSIALALALIAVAGYLLGRLAGLSPWTKAARMAVVAVAAFLAIYSIEEAF